MRYGINLLLWTDTLTDDKLPLLEQLKKIGFDLVELPLFDDNPSVCARWGARLDELGLGRTGTVVRGPAEDPMSADPAVRRKGVEANKRSVDCCAAAGAEIMAGPFHSALGCFSGSPATPDQWKWAAESMRQVAEHAAACNVKLAMEYLNRFECYLLNTAADGARFAAEVNHPYCGMMYDTFHSHIEEKNTPAAIRAVKDCLFHVHISENDRSTPGQGNVRWAETFDTLKEVGYDGTMVVEAFGLALEKLAAATKIWRRMFSTEMQLAADSLAFMKAQVDRRW